MDRCIDGCMHACMHVYIKYTAETLYIDLESISLSLYLATSSRSCGCRFTNSILIAPPKKDRKVFPGPHGWSFHHNFPVSNFLFFIGSPRYASRVNQLPAPNRTIPTSDFNVKQSPETVAQTARSLDDFSVYTHVYDLQNVRFWGAWRIEIPKSNIQHFDASCTCFYGLKRKKSSKVRIRRGSEVLRSSVIQRWRVLQQHFAQVPRLLELVLRGHLSRETWDGHWRSDVTNKNIGMSSLHLLPWVSRRLPSGSLKVSCEIWLV